MVDKKHEIIEAMAVVAGEGVKCRQIKAALRHIAAERGYVLTKLPEPSPQPPVPYSVDPGAYDERRGWWRCFNAIETINVEDLK